ncbi:uncharacterized protein LOC123517190 [Portunus trituberculatus]|uniref:uncharacterized protein LOC123517190 n=1 Tax=Portunus trituberculatus TaxID=210409 RepID=UPI001E1CCE3F|nr:uncharacterized protein LOC123517190 [Portunus trituberculatus]
MSRHKQFLGLAVLVGWLSLLLPERASSFSEDATLRQTTDVIALSPFGREFQPRGESERAAGVPEDGTAPHTLTPAKDSLHFDVAAAHHVTRATPKEHFSPDSFTPSQPVSFSRFSFIPSRPPLGADTYFREDTEELAISPGRQVPRTPPIPRPHQIDSRRPFVHYTDRYEKEEEEGEYVPSYNQRQHFPNYEDGSVQYEDDERDPQYDDYHDPYHIRDEYYDSPSLPDHRSPHHEEIPHHQQRYPPIDTRQPLHRIRAEEGGGGDGSCKTVNKNGMTCEVCRDEEGSYSEHCSHSTRSDQDETYATGRRHSKRDAAPATFTKGPSGYIPQIPTEKLRSQVDRIAVQEERSSPSLTTTTAAAAKKAHHHGSETDLTTTTTTTAIVGPKEAESRQEMSFGFDFDDHDFTFHDDHLFDLDHEPDWYSLTEQTVCSVGSSASPLLSVSPAETQIH